MGNCLERSLRGRGGGSGGAVHYAKTSPVSVWVEEGEVVGRKEEEEEEGAPAAAAEAAATEVKIRITRKQLEDLLRRVEDGKRGGGGAPVQEVISELLCVAGSSSNFRHREEAPWRPSLQSIPE
ncbi:hypothetical protein BS78_02G293500 [Paspalum vaginatum]|nr:hypothetical protein BS78_02G293500 [Paspalum vaginatum]